MFKFTTIAIACVSALLLAAACGGGSKTIDVGNGDKVKVSTSLPDDFPDNFPVYDGADLEGAVEGEQEGIKGIVATWTTNDSFDDVKAFYEGKFEGGAWKSTLNGSAGGSVYWSLDETDGDRVGYVAVSDGDKVSIIATVGNDPNLVSGGSETPGTDETPPASDPGTGSGGGTSELPDEVDLPNDFPSDRVPLPDDARLFTANAVSVGGERSFGLSLYTKDSIEGAAQSYQDKLEGSGYSQTFETSDANGEYALYAENSDGTGIVVGVTINEGDVEGYRLVVLSVTEAAS